MAFADTLKQLPPIGHLAGLQLIDQHGATVATLDNKPGQAGSVAVYAALAERFGAITVQAAHEGLLMYAEHTADARAHPGKHPNIDRLIALIEAGGRYAVKRLPAA